MPAHYWVDNNRTALAVAELVRIGPELTPGLLAQLDDTLDAAGWKPTPGAEPNSACIINHTPCHYSAWNDAINTAEKTHTTTTLDTTATAAQQLAHLTGRDISDPIAALADALDNPGTTPQEALRQRGDHAAADLLDQTLNSPTDD